MLVNRHLEKLQEQRGYDTSIKDKLRLPKVTRNWDKPRTNYAVNDFNSLNKDITSVDNI